MPPNYGVLSEREAFSWNPGTSVWRDGALVRANGTFGREQVIMEFNPEAGASATPVFESYREMFSPATFAAFGDRLFPATPAQEEDGGVFGGFMSMLSSLGGGH